MRAWLLILRRRPPSFNVTVSVTRVDLGVLLRQVIDVVMAADAMASRRTI